MAQQVKKCVSTELIDGNGNFSTDGMKKFEEEAKLAKRGRSYGVVAIIGPQSSGKSTLLNQLFGTNFEEMDARLGRFQNTKGVCLAQIPLTESCLLVLDTEGCDSAERKDNTTFERQIALFVIATSEIMMINIIFNLLAVFPCVMNMVAHDVGRRNAASWPLLTMVFEVMLRIIPLRKVHLIFVLRDSMKTPLEILTKQLINQLEEVWNELPKPRAQVNTALRDRFKIEVVPLSSYEYQKKQFEEEVTTLRKRVVSALASSDITTNRINASAFTLKTKMIWNQIKENKDLNLLSQKVTLTEMCCNKTSEENYQKFLNDLSWIKVKNKVDSGAVVQGFGKTVSPLINTYLSKYDTETQYFDEAVRAAKRKLLHEKILQVIEPAYRSVLERITVTAMENFMKAIANGLHKKNHKKKRLEEIAQYQTKYLLNKIQDQFEDAAIKQANWNHATTEHERLRHEMCAYVDHIREIIKKKNRKVIKALKIGCVIASVGLWLMGIPFTIGV